MIIIIIIIVRPDLRYTKIFNANVNRSLFVEYAQIAII